MAQKCTDCGRKRRGTSRAARRRGGNWTCGDCIKDRKPYRTGSGSESIRRQGAFTLGDAIAAEAATDIASAQLKDEKRVKKDQLAELISAGHKGTKLFNHYRDVRKAEGFKAGVKRRHFDNIASTVRGEMRRAEATAILTPEPIPAPKPEPVTGLDLLLTDNNGNEKFKLFDDKPTDNEGEKSENEVAEAVTAEIFDESGTLQGSARPEESTEAPTGGHSDTILGTGTTTPTERAQTPERASVDPKSVRSETTTPPRVFGGDRVEQLKQLKDDYQGKMDAADEAIRVARIAIARAEEEKRQISKRLQPRLHELDQLLDLLSRADQWIDDEGVRD